jgi:uncharacterized protein YoaH (UPF0181 family)
MRKRMTLQEHDNYLREHIRRFHDYVSQGMSVGKIITMSMREIIELQTNSEPQPKIKNRGPHDFA